MTPGINAARKNRVNHKVHEYIHDPAAESYGLEAAEKMGVASERVFKTLVVNLDGKVLAVGVVPVDHKLNMKHIARALGGKKASMADPGDVERSTGYVLGGVSPLGQKKSLRTVIDESATRFPTIFVSAGRRGLEIELSPDDLCTLVDGSFASISDQPPARG
ncbi:Cys-tRNA(Pro) deacylase [Haliea sp. E17]|uniref:Cys-tRNA(Pro) deacylase n=1 Tax=Haliea sp. E17 TaxID=3401576 RepID=UPI003AAF4D46